MQCSYSLHISYLWLSNKSRMLIQSAGQPKEMSVCVFANDVSVSPSNSTQFSPPPSSLDRPVSFLNITAHFFFCWQKVSSCSRDDERRPLLRPAISRDGRCVSCCDQIILPHQVHFSWENQILVTP